MIHASAIVSPDATIGDAVSIGPGAIVEDDVVIGDGTSVGAYAILRRFTRIGRNNRIDAHAVIGGEPQHTAWDGSDSSVVIGDDNVLREYVTVHRAFENGASTRIGSGCYLMAYTHIGHDCVVGDNVTMTNSTSLGGHVEIGNNAVMGGVSGVHQFVRVGAFCMIGTHVVLKKDALPFTVVAGVPVRHFKINRIGLRRNGITGDRFKAIDRAFRAVRDGDKTLAGIPDTEEIVYLREWLSVKSRFGLYRFANADD